MALIQGNEKIYHRCLGIYSQLLKKLSKNDLINCLSERVNNHLCRFTKLLLVCFSIYALIDKCFGVVLADLYAVWHEYKIILQPSLHVPSLRAVRLSDMLSK